MSLQSVYRGSPISLGGMYEDGAGDLTDPLLPKVTIRDPLGVAVVTDAVPTRVSLGNYTYTFTVPSNAILGYWTISWSGTVAGQGLGGEEAFNVLAIGAVLPVFNGSYTYDPTTDIGYIRLNIDDRDLTAVSTSLPYEKRSAIFTDEELGVLLADVGDRNAAVARALMAIANNRSLMIQYRRIGRTEVNFGSIRSDLLASAKMFFQMANESPAEAYAEVVYNDFGLRQVIWNSRLREGA